MRVILDRGKTALETQSEEETVVFLLQHLGKAGRIMVQIPNPEIIADRLGMLALEIRKTPPGLVIRTPGATVVAGNEVHEIDTVAGGDEPATLEAQVGRICLWQGVTLATAESCTGGLLAQRITDVPGSSAYFRGGMVTYSLETKKEWLGVSPVTLERSGAVSVETAEEMARNVRQRNGVSVGVGVTGLAGPTDDGSGKNIGLVYLGFSSEARTWAEEIYCPTMSRYGNKLFATEVALWRLKTYLLGGDPTDEREKPS